MQPMFFFKVDMDKMLDILPNQEFSFFLFKLI